jgi:hypothetical protein
VYFFTFVGKRFKYFIKKKPYPLLYIFKCNLIHPLASIIIVIYPFPRFENVCGLFEMCAIPRVRCYQHPSVRTLSPEVNLHSSIFYSFVRNATKISRARSTRDEATTPSGNNYEAEDAAYQSRSAWVRTCCNQGRFCIVAVLKYVVTNFSRPHCLRSTRIRYNTRNLR